MMAASGDRQQQQRGVVPQVQYVLLHHGHLIGTATAAAGGGGGDDGEDGDEVEEDEDHRRASTAVAIVQLATGDEDDQVTTNVEIDGDVDVDSEAVVIECVEATDDAYVECIGLDIDPCDGGQQVEEGDDPAAGGTGEGGDTIVESDVEQLHEGEVIAMKANNGNNNNNNDKNNTSKTDDDQESGGQAVSSEATDGSVLRTLLQANRRQLMLYQSHTHSSERIPFRGGRTTYARRRQVLASSSPSANKIDGPTDYDDDDAGESRAAVAHIEASTPPPPPPTSDQVVVTQRIGSQIKALLLGHNYVRDQDGIEQKSPAVRRKATPIGDVESSNAKKNKSNFIRFGDQDDEHLHPLFAEVLKVIAEFSDLNYSVQYGHRSTFLEVRRKGLYGIPSLGQTPVQVVVSDEGIGQFVSLTGVMDEVDCEMRSSTESSVAERLRPLLHKLSIKSGHVYCPGIDPEFADSISAPILLGMCNVIGTATSKRHRSKDCEVWHSLVREQNNQSNWLALNDGVYKCRECRRLDMYLRTVKKKRTTTATPAMTTPSTINTAGTTTSLVSTTTLRENAKHSTIVERTTAVDVETGQEYICVWGTAEEMET